MAYTFRCFNTVEEFDHIKVTLKAYTDNREEPNLVDHDIEYFKFRAKEGLLEGQPLVCVLYKNELPVVISLGAVENVEVSPKIGYFKLRIFNFKKKCYHIFPYAKSYENLKRGGYLTFESTSFLRGTTIDNSVIIVDELQNLSWHECNTVMTRVGNNSKIIFIGDDKQTDLNKKNDTSGFKEFVNILNRMKSIERVVFTPNDVVRSGIVKEYLKTLEGY